MAHMHLDFWKWGTLGDVGDTVDAREERSLMTLGP